MNILSALVVTSPYDGSLLEEVKVANARDVEHALSVADSLARRKSARLPLPQRLDILHNTIQLMQSEAEVLAKLATSEGGKPLTDSRIEVQRAIDGVQCCIEALRTEAGRVIPMNLNAASSARLAFTQKEPIGVVVAVSAFNHPLNLIVHQVAPAVAAGCPVIVKPADDTPLSCLRFVELLHRAGLPVEWCQALVIPNLSLAQSLVTDPRVALFSFIGSAKVGWILRSQLAAGTRCLLEHGGIAPVIVFDDADLDDTADKLVKGAYYHAGQVCVSVQKILAQQNVLPTLSDKLAERISRLKTGNPLDTDTDVGPLIRPREIARIEDWVNEAVSNGASLESGGERLGSSCYLPTLLTNVTTDSTLYSNEIFGPVALLQPFETPEQAFAAANSSHFAFQAAVFTQNIERMTSTFRELDASAVMVNDHSAFRTDWMPFAGRKQSGLGIGGIGYTLDDMQLEKMLVMPG